MQPNTTIKKREPDVPFLKDIAECTAELKQRGYSRDFRVDSEGLKSFDANSKAYSPRDVKIINFYRFEGVSDPGDMTVLYVIETSDGLKGTLADGYGPYASEDVSKFIVQVEEIHKEIPLKDA